MRMRIMTMASLALLLAPGVTLSQDESSEGEARLRAIQAATAAAARTQPTVTLFPVRYYPVRQLAAILNALFADDGARVVANENTNTLIVQAKAGRMEEISHLVQQLDVAKAEQPAAESLTCRIYMLEVPRKDQTGNPFAVVLQTRTSDPVVSQDMIQAIKNPDLRITRLRQGHEWTPDGTPRILITGVAASEEAVERVIAAIPDSAVSELKWGSEASTTVPVAQFTQLPESLQQHIRKFLGQEVQTVGYWFGSLSLPGKVRAPVGPWWLELETELAQGAGFRAEIEVTEPPELITDVGGVVLSNSLEGKIGKPIIIGYNRDSYGTRVMGALVILPEADTSPAEPQAKSQR